MVNESLEILIQNAGKILGSEVAKLLRDRLNFLPNVSQSDFDFVLNQINNQESAEDKNPRTIDKTLRYKIENYEEARLERGKSAMLEYVEAKRYAMKKAPDLDETIVIANTDCIEKAGHFFYEPSAIDDAIGRRRKYQK
ncbi:MAG: hypothetical protein ABIF18_01775 [archaeon]